MYIIQKIVQFFYLMSTSAVSRLMTLQCDFQKNDEIFSSKRRVLPFFTCFSHPCPEWRDRRRERENEREKWKGHEWWMLCVCLSFPITELCLLKRRSDAFLISAFLTDEEQALTGGTVCFKHRFTSHSLFTSDTIHCISLSCSAPFVRYNFLDLYSFSCSVIKCIVSLHLGLLEWNAEKNDITYHVFF